MKLLICGASRLTDELLKRLGEHWEITLVDKAEKRLHPFSTRFSSVVRLVSGDGSSPVLLEEAGLADHDYVLALTDDDRVNLAICQFARREGVKNRIALVRDPERLPDFEAAEAWTVPTSNLVARHIYRYLKDPRVNIINLGQARAELMELEIGKQYLARYPRAGDFAHSDWRLVGLFRKNELLFPQADTPLKLGDRLLILGKSELYNAFSRVMEAERPHFPRTYGQELILGVFDDDPPDKSELINSALYFARNTQTLNIQVVCEKGACKVRSQLARWSESLEISLTETEKKLENVLTGFSRERDAGVVVIPRLSPSFVETLLGTRMIDLAHQLPCPLLVVKSPTPYDRILVPFNGTLSAQRSLEIALDLASQFRAEVTAVIVKEPDFLHGRELSEEDWEKQTLNQVRELARIHKIKVKEQVRAGNPVREILSVADGYNLLVMGSSNREKSLFTPNVGDLLARKAPCSVLVVAG